MPRIQGVYKITNVRTTETYIGSSVDITRRWADHRRELRLGIHKNSLLQAAFACDGVRNFAITTLELVDDVEHLVPREQHYLETLVPFYNHGKIAVRAPYRTWRSDEADRVRFWSKVDQSAEGCWLWQGTLLKQGYGCFKIAGKMYKAHRLAYTFAKEIIPPGLFVCHHCDNPPCVRPDHLFLGTIRDNVLDSVRKGRWATGDRSGARMHPERITRGDKHWLHLHPELRQGELNGRAVLNGEQVAEIRARYAEGNVSQFMLADEYNVAQTTISAIICRKNWNY